ncbi:MAG: DUF5689 domain-containing protein [Bacteroidota bacterium]
MNTFKNFITLSVPMMLMLFVTSCVDKDFDEPPIDGTDPEITVTHTIDQIKNYYVLGTAKALPDSAVISGIVISDDLQGNIYKDMIISDSTGGILIRVDISPLSPLYGKGRRVFIKCAGLYISDYSGMIQIGIKDGNAVGRIPSVLAPDYIVRGMWNQPFPVRVISSINALNPNDRTNQNISVRFNNAHFTESCNTWADVATQQSGNRIMIDSSGATVTVRTSGFSTFAASFIPADTGTVEGILQVFNGTFQLILRDLDDLKDFSTPPCVSAQPVHSIQELQSIYNGTAINIANGSEIEGIVISDKNASNITSKNLVIQQGNYGVVVRFLTNNTFNLGDKIKIDISGQELIKFHGLLEVNNVDISLATLTGTGIVTPRIATLADINANGQTWESTLVTIAGVTISGGAAGTYDVGTALTDATGTLPIFTTTYATFAGNTFPVTPVTITGYIGDYDALQLNIRNTSDVQ